MIRDSLLPSPRFQREILPQVMRFIAWHMRGKYIETQRGFPVALIPFGDTQASVTLFPPQNKRGKKRRNTFEVKVRYPANEDDQHLFAFPVFFSEDTRRPHKKKMSPVKWQSDLDKILWVLRSLRFDPLKNAIVLEERAQPPKTETTYLREGKTKC